MVFYLGCCSHHSQISTHCAVSQIWISTDFPGMLPVSVQIWKASPEVSSWVGIHAGREPVSPDGKSFINDLLFGGCGQVAQ